MATVSLRSRFQEWRSKVPPWFWEFWRIDKAFRWARLKDDTSKYIIVGFRFVFLWALGCSIFNAPTPYALATLIHSNSTLLSLPNAQKAHWSLEVTWYLSIWEFVWMLLSSFLAAIVPAHMLLLVVDAGVLGGVSAAFSQSLQYIPDNDTCTASGDTWQAAANGLNLFSAIGQIKNQTASSVCYDLYGLEQIQLTIVCCLAILLFVGFVCLLPPEHPLSGIKWLVICLIPLFLVTKEIVIMFSFIIHWIANSRTDKPRRRRAKQEGYEMAVMKTNITPLPDRKYASQNEAMERVFGIEHIFAQICTDLCYRDVIQISRATRTLHDLVLPPEDLTVRIRKLRAWTCDQAGDPQDCFVCKRRICTKCASNVPFSGRDDLAHVQKCQPACNWCHYTQVIRDRANVQARRQCPGHFRVTSDLRLCELCHENQHPTIPLAKQIEARVDAAALRYAQKANCRYCGGGFRVTTRRWWECTECSKECLSKVHVAHLPPRLWKKRKGNDVEDAAG